MRTTVISENNHYIGFGPDTARVFGKMMGLKEKIIFPILGYKTLLDLEDKNYSKFEDLKHKSTRQSAEISDFL